MVNALPLLWLMCCGLFDGGASASLHSVVGTNCLHIPSSSGLSKRNIYEQQLFVVDIIYALVT